MFDVRVSTANIRRVATDSKNEFIECDVQSIWKWREQTEPNINDDIWSHRNHRNHRNPILWGHFLSTVKLLFMLFMIWCFCRLYLSQNATILHLIQFAFDFDQKKMLGKFSWTIPFHLIINVALCALCDFRCILQFKFV